MLNKVKRFHLPRGWIFAPKIGTVILGKLISPLDGKYTPGKTEYLWTPTDLIESVTTSGYKLGMVINLTSATSYYDGIVEFESRGILYKKCTLNGNGCNVPIEAIRDITKTVHDFLSNHSDSICVIHCTHGLNRCGMVVCSYLCEYEEFTIDDAVCLFNKNRSPGIYRPEILTQLEQITGQTLSANNKNINSIKNHQLSA